MGDDHERVLFDFDGVREVHSSDTIPEVGDRVTHRGDLWTVQEVESDDVGVVVTCKLDAATRGGESGASSTEAVFA
jgi:hypothetical protein